jgi:hypothetical protein
MARWFIFSVTWDGVSPLPRNLAIVNRRLRRLDPDAPELTEYGFVDPATGGWARWREPTVGADDLFRLLRDANCRPLRVSCWECRCSIAFGGLGWEACDRHETECPGAEDRGRWREDGCERHFFDWRDEACDNILNPRRYAHSKRAGSCLRRANRARGKYAR